jgi:hypothetical protein
MWFMEQIHCLLEFYGQINRTYWLKKVEEKEHWSQMVLMGIKYTRVGTIF